MPVAARKSATRAIGRIEAGDPTFAVLDLPAKRRRYANQLLEALNRNADRHHVRSIIFHTGFLRSLEKDVIKGFLAHATEKSFVLSTDSVRISPTNVSWAVSPTLRRLDAKLLWQDEAVTSLEESLRQCTELQSLKLDPPYPAIVNRVVEAIVASGCHLKRLELPALPFYPWVSDISSPRILESMFSFPVIQPSLQILRLGGIGLSDTDMKTICQFLRHPSTNNVRELHLAENKNRLSDEALSLLFETLRSEAGRDLEVLHYKGFNTVATAIARIDELFPTNTSLKEIVLSQRCRYNGKPVVPRESSYTQFWLRFNANSGPAMGGDLPLPLWPLLLASAAAQETPQSIYFLLKNYSPLFR